MTEYPRIHWYDEPAASTSACTGGVGSVGPSVFTITKPSTADEEYILTTCFPGMEHFRGYDDDPEKLKREAERWLIRFAASLGAVFQGEPAKEG
jgi:hypothetical protein